jgi:hypothetical protein
MTANHPRRAPVTRQRRRRMAPSIFQTLVNVCDDLDRAVRALEPGPQQDRFSALVQRLDEAIDRTIGLEQPLPPEEDER